MTATRSEVEPTLAPPASRRWDTDRSAVVAAVVVGLALAAYPLVFGGPFALNVGILALTFATAAVGWNLLGGYTGQVSFGHALFFGIGAYTTTYLVIRGWSPWPTVVVGMVLAGLAALVVGWPTFRLRSHYFSIATIAVTQIVLIVVTNTEWLGRATGLEMPIVRAKDYGLATLAWSPRDKAPYYYVALAMFAAAYAVAVVLLRGRLGVYAKAVRDDQEAAAAIGVPVRGVKLTMALASGVLTALPGSFFALNVNVVDPASVIGLNLSIQIALVAVLGGVGTLVGPLLGAWTLVLLQESTRSALSSTGQSYDLLVYGALIVAVTLVEPGGIVGLARRLGAVIARTAPAGLPGRAVRPGGPGPTDLEETR